MNESDIHDKMDELRAKAIQDNRLLRDALADCLDEVRDLINARGIDDRLNAIDELIDAINDRILNEHELRREAIELLSNDEQALSDMDDAGHKESDFR